MTDTDSSQTRSLPNFDLKEQIRDYWSRRSETFDQSPAHGIHSAAELEAWKRLIRKAAPKIDGARVLELASGTGEFTRVLRALECRVDGLDLSEAMIARARVKHGAAVKFYLGDAENTMLGDGLYDAVLCRHLVWTLLDPVAAFHDWLRVLRPGGRVIIIDGNWQHTSAVGALAMRATALVDRVAPRQPLYDGAAHRLIEEQLYFREGLAPSALARLLETAGFENVEVGPAQGILAAQLRHASWRDRLHLLQSHGRSFVVTGQRPDTDAQSDFRFSPKGVS